MEYISKANYVRTSPRKAREVVFMVRKLTPESSLEVLPHVSKRFAGELSKIIAVAIANAVNKGAVRSELRFKEIQVNEGPKLKRFRPGSRGAAKPYVKRMSHVRVVLETANVQKEKPKSEKKTAKVKEKK